MEVTYKVPRSIPDNFGAPIGELLHLINLINSGENEGVIIDFSDCRFGNSFHLGTIAMLLSKSNEGKLPVKLSVTGLENPFIRSYLSAICFPNCFDTLLGSNIKKLDTYSRKTYIPIVKFPANSQAPNDLIREKMLEAAGNVIQRQLQLSGEFLNAVKYFISEITNNVADHSKGDSGYMFAQYFSHKLYIDLCVIDDGRGIFDSFANSTTYHPASHVEAIEMAVNGCSTKGENSRGFGIPSSRHMLVKGLGGRFLMWSGCAGYLEQRGAAGSGSVELAEKQAFPGTFVGFRIPLNPNPDFRYIDYLE